MSDQRDYTLMVQNEQGVSSGFVRVRVTSPLSPALMITSAFVFICGLFLCSLLFLFIFKKRQQFMSGAQRANNGSAHSSQANGNAANSNERRRGLGRKDKNLLVGQSELANGATTKSSVTNQLNGHQQQTKGTVNGTANGLANGAANPSSLSASALDDGQVVAGKGHAHGLMSMASSDTSCNDQKQLLASNCSSDRNSSVGGDSSSGAGALGVHPGDHHYHHNILNAMTSNGSSTDRSTANSSPSQMNHISVDDELNLNGTYQATEPVTRGAKLSPQLTGGGSQAPLHHLGGGGQGGLIYANIDYNRSRGQHGADEHDEQQINNRQDRLDYSSGHRTDLRGGQHSPEVGPMRRRQQTPPLSPSGSSSTVQENTARDQRAGYDDGSSMMRSSVGATIALMNSLAAAQSEAAAANSPTLTGGGQASGALNGAISQQLMANSNNRVRKPGPPKPPKPSIQQRSRFYQQQAANGLVMIGDSQMGTYPMGEQHQKGEPVETGAGASSDLAVEYSRLAFPARAEL